MLVMSVPLRQSPNTTRQWKRLPIWRADYTSGAAGGQSVASHHSYQREAVIDGWFSVVRSAPVPRRVEWRDRIPATHDRLDGLIALNEPHPQTILRVSAPHPRTRASPGVPIPDSALPAPTSSSRDDLRVGDRAVTVPSLAGWHRAERLERAAA